MIEEAPDKDAGTEGAPALSERIAGAVFALLGLGMWFGTAELTPTIPGTVIGPALLPRICAIGFFILGLALFAFSLRRSRPRGQTAEDSDRQADLAGFAVPVLLVAVWLLAASIGFLTTTALAGFALMRLRGGTWAGSAICAVLIVIAVHFLFTDVMRIQMPEGIFY